MAETWHRRVVAATGGLATQPRAVSENVKSEKPRKTRERKRRKPLKRQQPERKEKYRERQCRANRTQHHKLSKLLPLQPPRTDLYVELVGLVQPGDGVSFDVVQLYR
jgi:hypothetical protein